MKRATLHTRNTAPGTLGARMATDGTAGRAEPAMVRRSIYTGRDAFTAFDRAVKDAYHERRGAVPQHAIIAALLEIAVAHLDELPQHLAAPRPTDREDD